MRDTAAAVVTCMRITGVHISHKELMRAHNNAGDIVVPSGCNLEHPLRGNHGVCGRGGMVWAALTWMIFTTIENESRLMTMHVVTSKLHSPQSMARFALLANSAIQRLSLKP